MEWWVHILVDKRILWILGDISKGQGLRGEVGVKRGMETIRLIRRSDFLFSSLSSPDFWVRPYTLCNLKEGLETVYSRVDGSVVRSKREQFTLTKIVMWKYDRQCNLNVFSITGDIGINRMKWCFYSFTYGFLQKSKIKIFVGRVFGITLRSVT